MKLNEYQNQASEFAIYQDIGFPFVYSTLGLAGEAGEVVEKVKKICRNHNGVLTDEIKMEMGKELGDVLWYLADLSKKFGFTLEEIAQMNISKLDSRARRGVIASQGDNR